MELTRYEKNMIVRLLNGECIEVVTHQKQTISDLKHALAKERESLRRCELFHRGSILRNDALVTDLVLNDGSFLTVLEGRVLKTYKNNARAGSCTTMKPTLASDGLQNKKPSDLEIGIPDFRPNDLNQSKDLQNNDGRNDLVENIKHVGQPLDTLLPGYASRPNPSPQKPPRMLRDSVNGCHISNDVGNLVGQDHSISLETNNSGSGVDTSSNYCTSNHYKWDVCCREPIFKSNEKNAKKSKDFCRNGIEFEQLFRLPLPKSLEYLELFFLQISRMFDFLTQAMVKTTWKNFCDMFQSLQLHENDLISLQNLKFLAQICPEVVQITGVSNDELDRLKKEENSCRDITVNLTDPISFRGAIPKSFIHQVQSLCLKIKASESCSNMTSALVLNKCMNDDPEDALHGTEDQCISRQTRENRMVRQLWALRISFAAVMLYSEITSFSSKCSCLCKDKINYGSKKYRKDQKASHGSVEGKSVEEMNFEETFCSCGETPYILDLFIQGQYHPDFAWSGVSLDDLKNNLQAPELQTILKIFKASSNTKGCYLPWRTSNMKDICSGRCEVDENSAFPKNSDVMQSIAGCCSSRALNSEEMLEHLKLFSQHQKQIAHIEHIEERKAKFAHEQFVDSFNEDMKAILASMGIKTFYIHQEKAIKILMKNIHTVISTSTASGKSLCYTVPIMQSLIQDPKSTALLCFPTKALAQDQLKNIRSAIRVIFGKQAENLVDIYDGDVSLDKRSVVRDRAQILLTNPDMLHVSILPFHKKFLSFFSNLKFCVVDEAHIYRGTFGMHAALVLRRMRRICILEYKRDPTFAITTATLGNPVEHASNLLGIKFDQLRLVDDDGSPSAARHFILWNPPYVSIKREENIDFARSNKRKASCNKDFEQHFHTRLSIPIYQSQVEDSSDAINDAKTILSLEEKSKFTYPYKWIGNSDHEDRDRKTGGTNFIQQTEFEESTDLNVRYSKQTGVKTRGGKQIAISRENNKSTRLHLPGLDAESSVVAEKSNRKSTRMMKIDRQRRRRSPIFEIASLLSECVQHNLISIAFCQSRKLCELVASYTRDIILSKFEHIDTDFAEQLSRKIAVYRGGYSPEERREIESALFSGNLLGIASTNALELGIDVRNIDITLHLGFPGSISSLKQQSGRAGRHGNMALSIYVAWESPLDQYYFSNPEKLFSKPIESVIVEPSNAMAMRCHLTCAALEHPLLLKQEFELSLFGGKMEAVCCWLLKNGIIGRLPNSRATLHYTGIKSNPAETISLRSIDTNKFIIIDERLNGKILEEVEESKAFYCIYDGAVYMNQGKMYLVKKLDLKARVAIVHRSDVKYYTRPVDYTTVTVVGGKNSFIHTHAADISSSNDYLEQPFTNNVPAVKAICGPAHVSTRFKCYNRIQKGTGLIIDSVDLHLPNIEYETEATFVRIPATARNKVLEANLPYRDGLHAASHALLNVVPMVCMVDTADIATECDHPNDTRFRPERILIYDRHPGGMGVVAAMQPFFPDLLKYAYSLVISCKCNSETGCPSCVQFLGCSEYNVVLNKHAAIIILEELINHSN